MAAFPTASLGSRDGGVSVSGARDQHFLWSDSSALAMRQPTRGSAKKYAGLSAASPQLAAQLLDRVED